MPTPDAWHDGWGDSPQDTWTDAWGNRHLYDPDRDSDWGQDEPPDPLTEEQNRRLEQEQLAVEEGEKRMRRGNGWFGGKLYDEYQRSQKDPSYRPQKFDDGQEKKGLFPLFPEKQDSGRSIFHRKRRYDET